MKLKVGLLIICTIFITGWIVTHVHAADATTNNQSKIAWQYNTFDCPSDDSYLDKDLNDFAKKGWEIISVSKYVDPSQGLRACVTAKIQIVPGTNSYKSGN
jgi:hypothetical protein